MGLKFEEAGFTSLLSISWKFLRFLTSNAHVYDLISLIRSSVLFASIEYILTMFIAEPMTLLLLILFSIVKVLYLLYQQSNKYLFQIIHKLN